MVLRQNRIRIFNKILHIPHGLANPLAVFNERNPHMPIAILAKANTRRNGDFRVFQE